MAERAILRLANPRNAERQTGGRRNFPRPHGPGRARQGQRFRGAFDRLAQALAADDPALELRQDPNGIAPERALVFVTAAAIQDFARVARDVGLEIVLEMELEPVEPDDDFAPAGGAQTLSPTLYATIPTIEAFRDMLGMWRAHQNGDDAPHGLTPWWKLFDLLIELRPWGPQDRFPEGVRAALRDRLPFNDDDEVLLELEVVPTHSAPKRAAWREETEQRVRDLGGRVVDRSSIAAADFVYEALLVGLSARVTRALIDDPSNVGGLAILDGIQFILPQTIGLAPRADEAAPDEHEVALRPNSDGPLRAALLDGTPAAAHPSLAGGIVIEDVHELVPLTPVGQRYHATSMASLILRGDLSADGAPLRRSRIVSVPLLVHADGDERSPRDRLLVDLIYVALVRVFSGPDAYAPDAFVVNLAIGVFQSRFAGRISSLARLIDWWAAKEGVLFVISAGNVGEELLLQYNHIDFETAAVEERRAAVDVSLRENAYERALLAPAEALNAITVGAVSRDLAPGNPPVAAGILRVDADEDDLPAVSSAMGLGPFGAVKPDLLAVGGVHEVRVSPSQRSSRLRVLHPSQRTGLYVASPNVALRAPTLRARGTSCAAALSTRALLQCAEGLTEDGGPYDGLDLPRRDVALLTRALAVNAAKWPRNAHELYDSEHERLGRRQHRRAKEAVARQFGYGVINPAMMVDAPEQGATLVGLGDVRLDQARIFDLPLPPSLSGQKVPRSLRVTIAWFSPVTATRARYRMAALEAVAADHDGEVDEERDNGWYLNLKTAAGPDSNMIGHGTVWSRRLVQATMTSPTYDERAAMPIRVQCKDGTGNLDPDLDIRFAIAVTLEIEAEVEFDVRDEIRERLGVRVRRRAT